MKTTQIIKIKPVKNLWICAGNDGVCDINTLSYYRAESIQKFLIGSENVNWKQWKKYGWVCIRANAVFEHVVK